MKRFVYLLWVLFLAAGLLVGCAQVPQEEPTPLPQPSAVPVLSTATAIPPTSIPPPTPIPFIPISGKVNVYSLNMRAGPGTVHEIVQAFSQGTGLKVVGKAPGEEWVLVEVADAEPGWMSVALLELDAALDAIPVVEPKGSLQVTGRVEGSDGMPISDIKVAVFQGGEGVQLRTDTVTDAAGNFYAFLPKASQGKWTVQVVGYRCASRIVEQNCQFSGVFRDNGVAQLELPQANPVVFFYEFPTGN